MSEIYGATWCDACGYQVTGKYEPVESFGLPPAAICPRCVAQMPKDSGLFSLGVALARVAFSREQDAAAPGKSGFGFLDQIGELEKLS